MRVAINGFGRIGRAFFRRAMEKGINVVAINSPADEKVFAYLLKYDSVHGRFKGEVKAQDNALEVNGKTIKINLRTRMCESTYSLNHP